MAMVNSGSSFRLDGRTALVTGARTGIGRAVSIGLAHAGSDLVLLGHGGDMSEVFSLAEKAGATVRTVNADISSVEEVESVTENILSEEEVDILVNNAGIIRRAPAVDHGSEYWDEVIATNLSGLFALTRLLARPMLERKAGKIINIASLLSFQGGINVPSYAASKHAVAGLTRALANEWAASNVQVNAIAPGYIETDNTEALRRDESRRSEITSRIPAGRWGKPEDLVGAAVFLASDASAYVSGHILAVDGGWLSR